MSFFYKNNEKIIILIQKILFYGYISSFLVLFFINPGIPGKGHFEKEFYRKYKGKLNELYAKAHEEIDYITSVLDTFGRKFFTKDEFKMKLNQKYKN